MMHLYAVLCKERGNWLYDYPEYIQQARLGSGAYQLDRKVKVYSNAASVFVHGLFSADYP